MILNRRLQTICFYCIPGIYSLSRGNGLSGIFLLGTSGFSFGVILLQLFFISLSPPVQAFRLKIVLIMTLLLLAGYFINAGLLLKNKAERNRGSISDNQRQSLAQKLGQDSRAVGAMSLILILMYVALFCPVIAPFDPDVQENVLVYRNNPPSFQHLLGTDKFGRDVFSRLLFGTRISLTIGIVTALLAVFLGAVVGAVAGYSGGLIDNILMRIVDVFFAFPRLFLILLIIALFSSSIWIVLVVLGLTGWMTVARLVRAEILSMKNADFVSAARVLGYGRFRILFNHLLPNALTPAVVALSLRIGNVILAESTLSFLGLGVQPPTASWGNMIYDGRSDLLDAWWVSTFPGIAIVITILCFNIIGDSIRDALDPQLQM